MPAERITLTELDVTSSCQYLQTTLKNEGGDGFSLLLVDGQNVWEGFVTTDDLDNQCVQLKMDFDTYVKETRSAFTRENSTDMSFECQFKTLSSDSGQLTWKKMPTAEIKYNLGSVNMKKCKNSGKKVCDVLHHCIANTQTLQSRLKALETDNERLSLERQNALKRLDKCVTAKEEMEKDLYSKFVAVLNSKKEKIRMLEENGVSQTIDDEDNSPVASTSRGGNKSAHIDNSGSRNGAAAASGDELTYDVDTDEEVTPPKKQRKPTQPAKLKTLESSLILGEEEEEQKPAPAARRPRRQAASKKQTPAKPTLPRVTSGDSNAKTDSLGKRSSLRKSGSNNSNRSSDNIDPDDLLDNF